MSDAYKLGNNGKWANRIVGFEMVAPDQLQANPLNWRVHGKPQQDSLAGVLEQVGWADAVKVSTQSGNVIDGHLRVTLALRNGEPTVPVLYLNVDESEEKLLLATFDPIGAMAETDAAILDELLRDVSTTDAALMSLLGEMAADAGLYGEPVVPVPSEQVEPHLISECLVEIRCTNADLVAFQDTLNEWAERSTVTVNVS